MVTSKPDQNKPPPAHPKVQPQKPKEEASDLYSYFAEAEDESNPKPQGGSGGMDDLI